MPIVFIPFGKGTGKFWILTIIVIVFLFMFIVKCEDLINGINSGEITNPAVILLTKTLYPLYAFVIMILNYFGEWGMLGAIPIVAVVIGGVLVFEKIKERRR